MRSSGANKDDIRDQIFRHHSGVLVRAALVAEASGVLSGIKRARRQMTALGLRFMPKLADGHHVDAGQQIATLEGNPVQIAKAEERLIGTLSKSSGIATAARRALHKAGSRCQVVCGGWKKMPIQIKGLVRQAVRDGGLKARISEEPFVYLDKNYVRILGGVQKAVQAALPFGRIVVVQIRGETAPPEKEALDAALAGAHIVMIDTGNKEHLKGAIDALQKKGLRERVQVAFGGSVSIDQLESLCLMGLDIADIGYEILDAPCIPMRFDVINASWE